MKNVMPEKYRQQAKAAIIVIAVGIALFMLSQNISGLYKFFKLLMGTLRPILIGVAIAYLLSPMLRGLEPRIGKLVGRKKPRPRTTRTISVLICYIVFLSIVTVFCVIVIPMVIKSLARLVNLIIAFINSNTSTLNEFLMKYGIITLDGDDFVIAWEGVINQAMGYVTALFTNALQITQSVYTLVLNLLVAFAVSVYSMFEKERFGAQVKKILYAFLHKSTCASLIFWMRHANHVFSGFISGKIVDSLIMGVLCYICMRVFKMDYPELISVVFGVTNIVPFFGPIVGGVIGTVLILIIDPSMAIWFALMALILQQLDGNLIGPHILGTSIGLSAFWIMLAILVGGGLFGFAGMLLSAPIFAIIYAIVRALLNFRLEKRGLPVESKDYIAAPDSLIGMGDDSPKND